MRLSLACSRRLAVLAAAVPLVAPPAQSQMQEAEFRPRATVAEQFLLQSINAERAARGLHAVRLNARLQRAAHEHALQIAYANDLSHRLRGEADLFQRGWLAGARFSRITENLAGGISIPEMHVALMHSPHHRENILDGEVDAVGISVVQFNGYLWAVEDFSNSLG